MAAPQAQASVAATLAATRVRPVRLQAGKNEAPTEEQEGSGDAVAEYGSNVSFWITWAALIGYAALFSPNQTPLRDQYFLEKILGLGVEDGVPINTVFFCLFNIMGVMPGIYASLLLPSGKSANGVPAWPFVTGSFAFGAFSLLPYFALWTAPREPVEMPSMKELKEGGVGTVFQRSLESKACSAILCLAAFALAGKAATAGEAAWTDFGHLFMESRFVHITSVDFITLSLLAPFWVWNDAQVRRWDSPLLPVCLAVPVLGPAAYLVLRPSVE